MIPPKEILPRLDVRVTSAELPRKRRGDNVAVGNLPPLELEVVLTKSAGDIMLPELSAESLTIRARKETGEGWSPVGVEVQSMRFSSEGSVETAYVSLFVPEDEAKRRAKAEKIMNDALDEGLRKGTIGEHFASESRARNAELVPFVAQGLLEHDAGTFELTAVLAASEGAWRGELRSRPLRIEVHHTEDRLDSEPFVR